MRHLSQTEAESERDFFSKKKNGKFTLTNRKEEGFYPPQFVVTGFDDYHSGVLGQTRGKHITHVNVKVSGPANKNVAIRFVGGHYEKNKLLNDYNFTLSTQEGKNEANIRIHSKDTGIVFILEPDSIESNAGNEDQIKVDVEFEFVEIKRFLLFSRFLNKYF
jgi:hypothetical protein